VQLRIKHKLLYPTAKIVSISFQNTPITKAFDRDLGIIDMHIGDMLWAISGKYLDALTSIVTLQILFITRHVCKTCMSPVDSQL
jgi:hypothetical protein